MQLAPVFPQPFAPLPRREQSKGWRPRLEHACSCAPLRSPVLASASRIHWRLCFASVWNAEVHERVEVTGAELHTLSQG